MPVLFACTWVAFLAWMLLRDQTPTPINGQITVERVGLVVLAVGLAWVTFRLLRLERAVRTTETRSQITGNGPPTASP